MNLQNLNCIEMNGFLKNGIKREEKNNNNNNNPDLNQFAIFAVPG